MHLDELLADGVPGVAAALISDGGIAESEAVGVACVESGERLTVDTLFEAASLAKPMFAVAVLELASEGQLDLSRPLADVVSPDSPEEAATRITGFDVLRHTTGFPNWRPEGGALRAGWEPGTRFGYSGEGFVALQHVVEAVTGESLDEFVRARVFDPLGMETASYVEPSEARGYACGHGEDGERLDRGFGESMARGGAAGGLVATARDVATFAVELARPRLFAGAVAKMAVPQSDAGDGISWGLGVGVQETRSGSWLWQWGSNAGYRHYVSVRPSDGAGVLVMTNGDGGMAVCERVAGELFGEQPAFDWLRKHE